MSPVAPLFPVFPTSRKLEHLTWPRCRDNPIVVVPVGSLEQHGPHLPLNTDTVIAAAVAAGLAVRLGKSGNYVVAPAVAYGASGEHQGFPGTTSIGTSALSATLIELTRSLRLWASAVIFVNGHGGNRQALESAVKTLRREGHNVEWVPCATDDCDPHAGFAETSLMLHLDLVNVRSHRAQIGNITPLAQLMPRLRVEGVAGVSPNGVLGDPTGADPAAGSRILEEMIDNAVRWLERRPADSGCLDAG